MKTPEELNALKAEVESLKEKPAGLTEEELKQVAGGNEYEPYFTKMRCEHCGGEETRHGYFLNMRFDCWKCRAKNALVGYDVLEYNKA